MKDVNSNSSLKKECALFAARFVQTGMRVGLGTGSTAAFFIEELGRRVKEERLDIIVVPTSFQSMMLAHRAGLIVVPHSSVDRLDISVDGADEVDPNFNLIKGGGAAHVIEKIVHALSDRFIVIADESKRVSKLGAAFLVPVEFVPASSGLVRRKLKEIGALDIQLRNAVKKDGPIVTENGNFVYDVRFNIEEPAFLEQKINSIPGVLDNGIFSSLSVRVDSVVWGKSTGVSVEKN